MFKFHSFTHSCPVFPALLIKETAFSSQYILASFVKDEVPIGAWVYLWAFCLVPWVCISVFVPVPYCLDDLSASLGTVAQSLLPGALCSLGFQDAKCFPPTPSQALPQSPFFLSALILLVSFSYF